MIRGDGVAQGVGSIRNNIITGMTCGMGLHLVFSTDESDFDGLCKTSLCSKITL